MDIKYNEGSPDKLSLTDFPMNLEDTSIKCSNNYTVGDFSSMLPNKHQIDPSTWLVTNSKGRLLNIIFSPEKLLLRKIGDHNQRKSISQLNEE